MGNQQLDLTNEQLQVLVSGKFGDGCLTTPKNINSNSKYVTNCKYEEYLLFKKNLLGTLCGNNNIITIEKNGYSGTRIYTLSSVFNKSITYIRNLDLQSSLNLLDELGIAMWIYDDGSLHKDKLFYNINTQAYNYDIQKELFIPFFNRFNIFPKITIEHKRDGREFYYLRVSRYEGAYEISKILNKLPLECYSYKRWSSETIQKWSKLQEELKSTDKLNISNRRKAEILRNINL